MNILLTNDDGIYAEGIYAIYLELRKLGRVTVVAPDGERSSIGHAITLSHPIRYKKIKRKDKFFGYGISGTPADCVKFANHVLLKSKPDIVVSGINLGCNDGCSVIYSGTVAGAREGAVLGIPSIAVSLDTFVTPADFSFGAKVGALLAKHVHKKGLPKGTFLNVNVPAKRKSQIKGIRGTSQGMEPIHCEFRKRVDPNFKEYYWMTGKFPTAVKNLTVDTYALGQNYVTVTPIHCDMTNYQFLDQLKNWDLYGP